MDNNLKIVGPAMPDMPWEDRPAGSKEVMWRYSANPIIPRDALSTSNSIFNSAVIPFKKGKYNYAGVSAATTPTAACASTPLSRWTASSGIFARRISNSWAPILKSPSGFTVTIPA